MIFKYCPAPTPGQRSINTFNEPILRAEGWQEAVVWLGHVIRLRGDTALSLCSLWAWGPMPRRVRGTDESGRGHERRRAVPGPHLLQHLRVWAPCTLTGQHRGTGLGGVAAAEQAPGYKGRRQESWSCLLSKAALYDLAWAVLERLPWWC